MDSSQFEDLYRRTYARVLAFSLRRTHRALAEDAVAATFLVAWRRRDELVDDPLPWLLGVARRVIANQLRGERRGAALVARVGTERFDREALLLTAWDGLAPHEAANVVGCTPATFRVRLHRARRRFAQALGDESADWVRAISISEARLKGQP
jgi:RNA polymerase sigma-70 factor (ECF subfamily)